MSPSPVLGEVSSGKVAAIFGDRARADEIATQIRTSLRLSTAQVQVVTPRGRQQGRKLEPESRGIFRTMIRAHARLGLLGAVLGAIAFGVLWVAGVPMIANSALMAAVALTAFGTVAGLMLGGLVTLRPDHDAYILKVHEAIGEGRCAVVVHALSGEQLAQAEVLLRDASGEVVSSIDL